MSGAVGRQAWALACLLGAATSPALAQRPGNFYERSLQADLADARLVRNVELVQGATPQLLRLRPVRYQVQSPLTPALVGPQRLGFVAQDLLKVYPGLVRRDYDAAGTMHVDYAQLIPVLTSVAQEQARQLVELQAQLGALRQEVTALRAENGRLTVGLATASVGGTPPDLSQVYLQLATLQQAVRQLQGRPGQP